MVQEPALLRVGCLLGSPTLTLKHVYGISEFLANDIGKKSTGTLTNNGYAVYKLEDVYGVNNDNIQLDASTWVKREGKIPMLTDFETLANSLGK